MAPDDGLLTLGNSIIRHVAVIARTRNATGCDLEFGPLLQVHTYHFNDTHKYNLFQVKSSQGNVEIAVKFLNNVVVKKPSPLMDHLASLFVSSDYDQKEQISRNFLRVLSPFSEPVLVYRFNLQRTSKVYNLTTLWLSPDGSLQDVVDFTVDESAVAGHVKPSLKQPILPGWWFFYAKFRTV